MLLETPLLSGWVLTADDLQEADEQAMRPEGFSLPGALELREFADLLGFEEEEKAPEEAPAGRAFSLPAMLPCWAKGSACLSREIDFSRMAGDHAMLTIDHLCGSGEIKLGERTLYSFGKGIPSARIDLTDDLRLGRKQTLSICFDDAKGAGVCGAVLLKTTMTAHFEEIDLTPDPVSQTLKADIRCHLSRAGTYGIRVACVPDEENAASPWQEARFLQAQAGEAKLSVTVSMRAKRFEAGNPYDAPVIKLTLHAFESPKDKRGTLLDAATLMTGYAGDAPRAYVPLTAEECVLNPDALISGAKRLNAHALFLPVPASDLLYRRAALEGVALVPYSPDGKAESKNPCASPVKTPNPQALAAMTDAEVCIQLCGMTSAPPTADPQAIDRELMLDAAGREIDLAAPEVAKRLTELRALLIRLRAEAARQKMVSGALCAPGEWREDAVAKALKQALSPLHLSALPLRGAWWAQSVFSASLYAFIPPEMRNGVYTAEAVLLTEQGETLASFKRDIGERNAPLGIIKARLPDHACALTLRTRLLRSGAVVEMQEIPVYVGERGPLEAAFLEI